jgi:hypothetical protein
MTAAILEQLEYRETRKEETCLKMISKQIFYYIIDL